MSQFFITGTDTDIGKTYISSIIFNSLGDNTCYYKPIQTGCTYVDNKIFIPDLDYVKSNSNISTNENFSCSYSLKHPISPHLSAQISNIQIDISHITNHFTNLKKKFENVLVEGAGGIFTPINKDKSYFIYNLIQDLKIKTILVTDAKIGTINHTLLTLNFLKTMNITISGIVFNKFKNTYYENDNIEFIKQYSNIENTLIIPYKNTNNHLTTKEISNFIKNI